MNPTPVLLEGRTIPLIIRRHSRSRRISLRLSPARDTIVLTLPLRASIAMGMKFFNHKAQWVLANVQENNGIALDHGAMIPVLGKLCRIEHHSGRGVCRVLEGILHVYGAPEFTARRVKDFLKKTLREKCMERAAAKALPLQKTVREVRVRDTRSRWGSCSAKGSLTFHWQLIFAPLEILDYLIAHEVAHLAEMNHSARFWDIVKRLCPDYASAQHWLKREGHTLHRFGR